MIDKIHAAFVVALIAIVTAEPWNKLRQLL